jgi:hypothetical protein
MYLDAVNGNRTIVEESEAVVPATYAVTTAVYDKWQDWPASEISHHAGLCCEAAREWLIGTDISELGGASAFTGPRWLRQRFKWGASSFPIFWCEAVRRDTLDCGALAALAQMVLTARGVMCLRAQMVQEFSEDSTRQWSESWGGNGSRLKWTNDELIYHEGCAIVKPDGEIKVWDSSAGWWIGHPTREGGYGSLRALRLSSRTVPNDEIFTWSGIEFKASEWTVI